jgi:hypothetical protein
MNENELQTEVLNKQLFNFLYDGDFSKDKAKELTEIMKSLNKNKVINTTEQDLDED